jgi:hypothetical protein
MPLQVDGVVLELLSCWRQTFASGQFRFLASVAFGHMQARRLAVADDAGVDRSFELVSAFAVLLRPYRK